MAHEKRTKKFIDRWTQTLIAGQVVLHSMLLIGLLALFLFAEPFVTWFSNYRAEEHVAIAKELILLNASKWPLFLVLALFTGATSIIFSHQIVGPIFKIGRILSQLNQRQLGIVVKFRQTDYFRNLEDPLNEVISRWKGDLASVRDSQKQAQTLLDELKANPNSPEKLKELERVIGSLAEVVRSYEGL